MSIKEDWELDISNEIVELHEFFQNWFNGSISKASFSRFSEVMSVDFQIISPNGDTRTKRPLTDQLRDAYGKNKNIVISVENITVNKLSDLHMLAVYHEIQEDKDERSSRISTAIFSLNTKLPNNYFWIHVHETWNK